MKRIQASWANLTRYDAEATEHRRAGRVRCDHLECRNGTVLNLSQTGARVRLRTWRGPELGQMRMLELQTLDDQIFEFRCRVARVRRLSWRCWEVGIEFPDLTDSELADLTRIAMAHTDRHWIHDGSDLAA